MYKQLLPIPDQDDLRRHALRCDVELLTQRCHEIVPVIGFVGGRVTSADATGASGEIPLLERPMNQNAIQLASNHYLLADWIVAVSAMAVLPGVSAIGLHEPEHSTPMQVWTIRGEVTHLSAGTGTIRTEWRPDAAEIARLRKGLIDDGQAQFETTVDVLQGDRVVSRVSLTQVILATRPREIGEPTTMIQAHALKVSALLVAGLRTDELSQEIAGQQGRALAQRMSRTTPQLPSLVTGRTAHLDALIEAKPSPFEQILLVGAGLDARALRLHTDAAWYGVDLEPGIKHRKRRLQELTAKTGQTDPVRMVAGDVRDEGWIARILEAGFDPARPSLLVVEGLSMYLERGVLVTLLEHLSALARNPASRLWVDHVTDSILRSELPEACGFLSTMGRMGEPFICGFDDPSALSPSWTAASSVSAAQVAGVVDPIAQGYRFSVLSSALRN